MGITLESELIEQLTYRGVLAYVATQALGDGCWTTAQLGQAVSCNASMMLEGLQELHTAAPHLVGKQSKLKWPVGSGVSSDERVQILDSEDARRADLLDDLKKYWECRNSTPFTMGAPDGAAVKRFLRQHKDWDRPLWRKALNNRAKSVVNHSQPLYMWLGRLAEYSETPLDKFNKPMPFGVGGRHGETLDNRQRNREAVAAATANA